MKEKTYMAGMFKQRMYFFVPYNLSPIQQAIQAGHAALEYAHRYGKSEEFIDFIDNHKTWIILNGGTTNSSRDFEGISQGSLNQIGDQLLENKIDFSYFEEPDLNNALTAVCFLADERVWDYENYPDIDLYLKDKLEKLSWLETFKNGPWSYAGIKEKHKGAFIEWVKTLSGGDYTVGEKNVFLRELLKGKKLA